MLLVLLSRYHRFTLPVDLCMVCMLLVLLSRYHRFTLPVDLCMVCMLLVLLSRYHPFTLPVDLCMVCMLLVLLSSIIASYHSLFVKSLMVAERPMPALLLQCAGDIKMNPGPVTKPTPTKCLRLMQWDANGISRKITELLTFLHSYNVNIAAVQETKLTNKTKPIKTPGWAAVRLDRHKNKGAAC